MKPIDTLSLGCSLFRELRFGVRSSECGLLGARVNIIESFLIRSVDFRPLGALGMPFAMSLD